MDAGGQIRDVFVYHKVYGVLKADMGIKSRRDIRSYMEEIDVYKRQAHELLRALAGTVHCSVLSLRGISW